MSNMSSKTFLKNLRDDIESKLSGHLSDEHKEAAIGALEYIDSQLELSDIQELSEAERIRRRIADEASISEHSLAEMVGALTDRIWTLETACLCASNHLARSLETDSDLFLKTDAHFIAEMLSEYGRGKSPKLAACTKKRKQSENHS